MSPPVYFVAAWLFVVGLYGVVTSRHLAHLIVCLAVAQSSPCVLLLAGGNALTHMLLLFEVVLQTAVCALLLALAVAAHGRSGETDQRRRRVVRE
jgi:multicomponent Na+:H+ antiporter subunit C